MLYLIPMLVGLAVGDSLPQAGPLSTRSVQAEGLTLVVHRQPSIPLVSLRLALLADDPSGYAGAGHFVQHLLFPTLRDQVARVGGRVQLERSADAVVYTVTGPTRELPYLAGVLRSALRPPAASAAERMRASRDLAEERLAEWETADRHVRSVLRTHLFPGDLPAAGTERSAQRLSEADVPALWAAMYRPERVSVVAVGDVTLSAVREAFAELPPAPPAGAELPEAVDTVSLAPLTPAEATQGWLGVGYALTDQPPAVVSVTARLLRDALQERIPGANVEGEHWWTHFGQALVLVAAAPEARRAAARRAVDTAVSTVEGELGEHRVREAARSLRREMLFFARTPDRMAGVLGRFTDRLGDPDAAQRFYAELEEVEEEDVRSLLRHMAEHTPVRIEIAPQQLRRGP